jgi:deazaflavin-dependent oxidoreductase (nitroreductase family)
VTDRPPRPPLAVIRPFTTHVFNPISRRFARWLPGFAILRYRGRASGKTYRTPLNVFRSGGDWIFALTYSSDVQWVKNVMASGEAVLEIRRSEIRLESPELFVDRDRRLMPQPVRFFLGLLGVSEFLRMHPAADGAQPATSGDGTLSA